MNSIDIFDENMNLLGTAMKSQAHREGLWHKTFIVGWHVKTTKERSWSGFSFALRTSRSIPICWTFPAAGHVRIRRRSERRLPRSDRLGPLPAKDDLIKVFTTTEIYQQGRCL